MRPTWPASATPPLLLLQALERSPDGRVLSVLSAGIHSSYAGYASDPELKRSYSIKNAAPGTRCAVARFGG